MDTEQEIKMLFSELDKAVESDLERVDKDEESSEERARKKGLAFDRKKFSERRQALKSLQQALNQMFFSIKNVAFNSRIYTMLDKLSGLYPEGSSSFSPLEAFQREIAVIKRQEMDKTHQQIQICRDSIQFRSSIVNRLTSTNSSLHGFVHIKRLVDGVLTDVDTITYENAIDRLERLLSRNTRFYHLLSDKDLGSGLIADKPNRYNRELSIINKYLTDKSIERVRKASNGFMGRLKSFVDVETIDTGKDAIMEINRCEERINQIKVIIDEFRKNSSVVDIKSFQNTYDSLEQLLKVEEKNLIIAQKRFENSDYKLIEQAVMKHRKDDEKDDLISEYAKLSSQLEYIKINDPSNLAEIRRLEYELMELSNGLSNEEIRMATQDGRTITMERLESDFGKNDVERVESRRDVETQSSNQDINELITESESARLEDARVDRARKDFEKAIEARRQLDNGIVSQAVSDLTTPEYYESTMGMSRRERALNTLISLGKIEAGKTIEELTPLQRDMLNAQMRLEQDISSALEDYERAKRLYEESMAKVRFIKTASKDSTIENMLQDGGIKR